MVAETEKKISWYGPEYFHKEKGGDWYWAVGIISSALVTVAILIENYIFALFIALASFTLMLFASRKPKMVEISINEKGVSFEKYFYPFDSIESFWINADLKHILIKSKKLLMPLIVLPLEENDPEMIREELGLYLDEEELNEPFFQKILEVLGF